MSTGWLTMQAYMKQGLTVKTFYGGRVQLPRLTEVNVKHIPEGHAYKDADGEFKTSRGDVYMCLMGFARFILKRTELALVN